MPEKILIIDDDVDTLRLVGLMLQRQGYQIIAANNGEQGLAHADSDSPDLILLDVMMPQMDGYEVARRLRANPDTANIPILMFTAKTQLDDKVIGFEVGANDYLTKPTHPSELQARVKAFAGDIAITGDKIAAVGTADGATPGEAISRDVAGSGPVSFLGAERAPRAAESIHATRSVVLGTETLPQPQLQAAPREKRTAAPQSTGPPFGIP